MIGEYYFLSWCKLNISIKEEDHGEFIEFITEGVLLIAISIFGFIGNSMSIYVLLRPTVRGSFSKILMGLASFDALFLLCAIATFGYGPFLIFSTPFRPLGPIYLKFPLIIPTLIPT